MPYDARIIRRLVCAALIVLAALFLARFSWQGEIVGLVANDAAYILLADYFSPYSSATRSVAAFVAQHGVFPPLYPLTLALAGVGADSVWWAHVMTKMMVLAAMYAAARLFRHPQSNPGVAFVYAAMLFLMPSSLLQHLELLSEPLYLALTLGALPRYQGLAGAGNSTGRRDVM